MIKPNFQILYIYIYIYIFMQYIFYLNVSGSQHTDEMCNLYLMYYMDEGKATFEECMNEESAEVTSHFPSDSDTPMPRIEQLEMKAKGSGHHVQNHITSPVEEASDNHHIKSHVLTPSSPSADVHNVTITMPGALPREDDSYMCSGFRVKDWLNEAPVYITNFRVLTTAKKVHHLIIQGCGGIKKPPGEIW